MKKFLLFLGTKIGEKYQENLIKVIYGKKTKFIYLKENQISYVDEELIEQIKSFIDDERIIDLGYDNGQKIIKYGKAKVRYNSVTPIDIEVTVNHNFLESEYDVQLSDNENYIVEKNTNNFVIKLAENGYGSKEEIYYVITKKEV